MSTEEKCYRYPGIRPFTAKEKGQFFGRSKETVELHNLIKVKQLVVLFSKSGIGKSSLLNAGVIPLLELEKTIRYHPISQRFQSGETKPADALWNEITAYLKKIGVWEEQQKREKLILTVSGGAPLTFWQRLKTCPFSSKRDMPILVLDQFEEFFNLLKGAQLPFVEELANLIYQRVPVPNTQIQQRLLDLVDDNLEEEWMFQWAQPLGWKIILSLRSDRLSLLDNLSSHIPAILDNRYQLHALSKRQAREAIVAPSKLPGDFITPNFDYEEAMLQKIINKLSNENGEVESFQLQMICQYIERKFVERGECS